MEKAKTAGKHEKKVSKTTVKTKLTKEKAVKKEKVVKKEVDEWKTLLYPHLTEKAMNMIELSNKLVFIVRLNSTKREIAEALEKGFNIKVLKVNTEITRNGEKMAYVKLHPDSSAIDIATRMGMI